MHFISDVNRIIGKTARNLHNHKIINRNRFDKVIQLFLPAMYLANKKFDLHSYSEVLVFGEFEK